MNIAGVGLEQVGLEQDVAMENVDMKIGPVTSAAGMAGFTASPHLLYFVILSVFRAVCGSIFGQLQAVGRYMRHPQGRRADRTPVLLLPTLCLALAFVFFNAAGAMAQCMPELDPTSPECSNALDPQAGTDATWNSGVMVTLDGSGSTDDGMITDYVWKRTGGSMGFPVADLTGVMPTFTAETRNPGVADVTHIFELTVTDDDNYSKTGDETVTITINAPPKAVALVVGDSAVKSGASVTLDGSMSDDDGTEMLTYAWTRANGSTTGLTTPATATAVFKPPTLVAGAPDATHSLTLTVSDEGGKVSPGGPAISLTHSAMVMITVTSGFADPVATAFTARPEVDPGDTVTLESTGSSVDRRRGPISYTWARTGGTVGGSVTLSSMTAASPTFTADSLTPGADDVTHTFTLTVTDSTGATAADTVTITVISGFADPVATAFTARPEVDPGDTVTLESTGSSVDRRRGPISYTWARTGGTVGGSVTLSSMTAASPTFTADSLTPGADDVTHTFTLTVTDSTGATAADTVTITVISGFADPVATAFTARPEVDPGDTVTLESTGSSVDRRRGPISYTWARTGGTVGGSVTLSSMTAASPTFTADSLTPGADDVTHTFTLTVTDSTGATAADTVTITVISGFADPVATAFTARPEVDPGDTVTLESTGSSVDRRRGPISYTWARTGGTVGGSVTLSSMTAASPTFTADSLTPGADDVTHTFTLTVTDSTGATAADTVTITVISGFADPVATAFTARPEVDPGDTVTLESTGSSVDRRRGPISYTWARTGGTVGGSVTLSSMTAASPTFTADSLTPGADDVTHTFTLTVTDSTGATAADTVTITVISGFADPVATAFTARPEVDPGDTVTLESTGSSVDRRRGPISYTWARTGGTVGGSVTLSSMTAASPTFTADSLTPGADDVTHTFTLTVTDSTGATAADTVTITVISGFADPVATAFTARPEVDPGDTVTLESTGSSVDRRRGPISYTWARTGGTVGGSVTLSSMTAASPTFTADSLTPGADDVTHTFTLTVTDSTGATATDTVTITVISGFAGPVANAVTAQSEVASGMSVTLDGSGSSVDRRRGPISYTWAWTGGTGGALSSTNIASPTFTGTLAAGAADVTYTVTLTVTDSTGATATDTVTIKVTSDNAVPVAEAGEDDTVRSGATVTLIGSGSDIDSDDATLTYAWERTGGTPGATVSLTDKNSATARFTAATPGADDVEHIFTLTVTDDEGAAGTDTVTITVTAFSVDIHLAPSDLKVQEGGSGTYRVRLSKSPGREVTITATSGNYAVVRLKNTRLVFNAGNWNDWQEVEIDAVADSVKKGDRIEVTIQHSLNGVASNKLVTVSVRAQEDDPILDHVGQFVATRATTLLGQQPDLIHFLKQDGLTQDSGGSFTFQATDGRLSLDGGFIHDGTWGEVTGARTNSKSTDTKSVLGSFGIHRKYSETFLTGLMLQFDRADHELPQQTGTIDGTGWLVGPYFVARHGSQPLYFEGRLLYGYSDNDIRFMDRHLGARTGSFDSTRVLAQIRVEGEIAVPGWDHGDDGGAEVPQLIPYADLRWLEDRAAAFTTVSATTGFRVPVPGQTVNISQLELGSNMVVPVAVPTGSMILTGGLGLVFSNTEGNHIKSVARGRGRGEIGFSYGLDENVQIDFESFYDGIGSSGYEGYGLSLNAEMRF